MGHMRWSKCNIMLIYAHGAQHARSVSAIDNNHHVADKDMSLCATVVL
jgi:hypothetical protein